MTSSSEAPEVKGEDSSPEVTNSDPLTMSDATKVSRESPGVDFVEAPGVEGEDSSFEVKGPDSLSISDEIAVSWESTGVDSVERA
jgi:hypothetical protein